jgi:hypothetical protein
LQAIKPENFMKQKILAQLKAKFPGVQSTLLDRVADELAKTVTKDEDIDASVNGASGLVSMFSQFYQSESDRRVTEAVKKREEELKAEFVKKDPKDPKDPKEPDPNDPPAWAKALIDANNALTQKVAAFENANQQKTLTDKVLAKFKELEIDEGYFTPALSGRSFKDDTEVESFVTNTETAYKTYKQSLAEQGLGQTRPIIGTPNPKTGVSQGVEEYLKSKENADQASPLGGKKL